MRSGPGRYRSLQILLTDLDHIPLSQPSRRDQTVGSAATEAVNTHVPDDPQASAVHRHRHID
jgi:hypothetical protein